MSYAEDCRAETDHSPSFTEATHAKGEEEEGDENAETLDAQCGCARVRENTRRDQAAHQARAPARRARGQHREGWGAKVIDRLAEDLREAFPDMKGFSPRNLKYMRAFATAWPDRTIVQEALAQIPWYHHIALMEKCRTQEERLWYARQSAALGWSHTSFRSRSTLTPTPLK